MAGQIATFELTETMKIDDCQRLHAFLQTHVEQPVSIDCKSVSRLSGLAAQTLVFGHRHWATGEHQFVLKNPEGGFEQSVADLGLIGELGLQGGNG